MSSVMTVPDVAQLHAAERAAFERRGVTYAELGDAEVRLIELGSPQDCRRCMVSECGRSALYCSTHTKAFAWQARAKAAHDAALDAWLQALQALEQAREER